MNKICISCGGDIKPGALKCSFCGRFVEDVAVDESMIWTTVAPNSRAYGTQAQVSQAQVAQAQVAQAQAAQAQVAQAQVAQAQVAQAQTPAPAQNVKYGGYNIFADANWGNAWAEKRANSEKLGIVLTDTRASASVSPFLFALNEYIAHKSANGVNYFLLDLKDQQVLALNSIDVESVTSMLRGVYNVAVPDYLMIVGDTTVIPNADWYNECDDGDETVPSDLPYITLDTESPWDGAIYDFENITQVGRIPAKATNDFAEAICYFNNTKLFTGYAYAKSFAYSALVWEPTSRVEFAHLHPTLITSPQYTSNSQTARMNGYTKLEKLSGEYNLVCFNLHGSDGSHVWYGQQGYTYPEAFEKSLLPSNNGYMLLTEACYGARPLASASIVVDAIMNRCVAFVGSSRIAYGMTNGGVSCADVIARGFTAGVAKGMTAGKAFLSALTSLTSGYSIDEEEIKTLAEFALYGDPSVYLLAGSAQKSAKRSPAKLSNTKKDKALGVALMSCDGKGRTSKNVATMLSFSAEEQAHIQKMANIVYQTGNDYVLKKFSAMSEVEPKVYKVIGREEYRAIYEKNDGEIKTVVKMHLDSKGNVKKVYNSK